MISVETWSKQFKSIKPVTIHQSGLARGACDILSGERFHFANVTLEFSPSDNLNFIADFESDVIELFQQKGYLNAICFGVLDVMLVGPLYPISNFNCVIKNVEYHDRKSSRLAFRLAARNGTQIFLSRQAFNSIAGWTHHYSEQ